MIAPHVLGWYAGLLQVIRIIFLWYSLILNYPNYLGLIGKICNYYFSDFYEDIWIIYGVLKRKVIKCPPKLGSYRPYSEKKRKGIIDGEIIVIGNYFSLCSFEVLLHSLILHVIFMFYTNFYPCSILFVMVVGVGCGGTCGVGLCCATLPDSALHHERPCCHPHSHTLGQYTFRWVTKVNILFSPKIYGIRHSETFISLNIFWHRYGDHHNESLNYLWN